MSAKFISSLLSPCPISSTSEEWKHGYLKILLFTAMLQECKQEKNQMLERLQYMPFFSESHLSTLPKKLSNGPSAGLHCRSEDENRVYLPVTAVHQCLLCRHAFTPSYPSVISHQKSIIKGKNVKVKHIFSEIKSSGKLIAAQQKLRKRGGPLQEHVTHLVGKLGFVPSPKWPICPTFRNLKLEKKSWWLACTSTILIFVCTEDTSEERVTSKCNCVCFAHFTQNGCRVSHTFLILEIGQPQI